MSKMIPQVIQGVDVSVAGYGYGGQAISVTLPTIQETTESHRGGTMSAPIKVPTGYEELDAKLVVSEFALAPAALQTLTRANSNAVLLVTGNLFSADGAKPFKAVMVGRIYQTEKPEFKAGQKVEITYTINCTTYALTIDGVPHEAININTGEVTFGDNEVWSSITGSLGI